MPQFVVGDVVVPNVVGLSKPQAEEELSGVFLGVTIVLASSSTVAEGNVISQDPAASSEVQPNGTVVLTVSSGVAVARAAGPVHSRRTPRVSPSKLGRKFL